jgi:hypothetical protein
VLHAAEDRRALLREVRKALERRETAAALDARRERFVKDVATRARRDARGRTQPTLAERTSAEKQHRRSARAQRVLRGANRAVAGSAPNRRGCAIVVSVASCHVRSSGTISVATAPGGVHAASSAARKSSASVSALPARRTQPTGRASDSMSEVSGASAARCQVAWSPTRFTIGECARRALWRFAMPFAKPGPKCSNVSAGRPVMRP